MNTHTICRADPEGSDREVWGSGMGFISYLLLRLKKTVSKIKNYHSIVTDVKEVQKSLGKIDIFKPSFTRE